MRLNVRVKIGSVTQFFMLSTTQTLKGITSKVIDEPEEKHLHYIFFDLDKCTQAQAEQKLGEIQLDFKLGDTYIFSDKEGSYRGFCWSKRPWITYLHILLHSFPLLDYGFWFWTVCRGAATLRTGNKIDRLPQKCVAILKGYEPTVFPRKLCSVTYDTGIEKEGRLIEFAR